MNIDVRCLPYMPLQIERLRKSKAWLRCKRRPELAFYLMNLWMRAWHEVPAGSIEADDDVLADAAMCSPDEWERVKADLINGWEEIDGRLFHSTVTELATEAAEKLHSNRRRTEQARQAKWQSSDKPVTGVVTEPVTEPKGREGKGKEIPPSPPAVVRPPPAERGSFLPPDWRPSPDAMSLAVAELGSEATAERTLEKFRNHWLAKSGKDGRKRDWGATWRNWVMSEFDRKPGQANGRSDRNEHQLQRAFDGLAEHARRLEDTGHAEGWR